MALLTGFVGYLIIDAFTSPKLTVLIGSAYIGNQSAWKERLLEGPVEDDSIRILSSLWDDYEQCYVVSYLSTALRKNARLDTVPFRYVAKLALRNRGRSAANKLRLVVELAFPDQQTSLYATPNVNVNWSTIDLFDGRIGYLAEVESLPPQSAAVLTLMTPVVQPRTTHIPVRVEVLGVNEVAAREVGIDTVGFINLLELEPSGGGPVRALVIPWVMDTVAGFVNIYEFQNQTRRSPRTDETCPYREGSLWIANGR